MPSDNEDSFTPSLWSKRLPASAVVPEHVRVTSEESERARRELPCRLGLSYGPAASNAVDFFFPAGGGGAGAPVVVYFSGGYWQELSGRVSAYPAGPLVAAGITLAVPDYSRAPGVTMSDIVDESRAAVRFVLSRAADSGASSVTLVGHSAGAHLCAMVLSSPAWLASLPAAHRRLLLGAVHLGGVFDLRPLLGTSIAAPLGLSTAEAEANSPLAEANVSVAASSGVASTLLFYGEDDAPGLIGQGREYAKALTRAGAKGVRLTTLPATDHFDLVENLSRVDYAVTRAIVRLAKGAKSDAES